MLNTKIEKYLEENNDNYMFLLLANKEIDRLNSLPGNIKRTFEKKLTEIALDHVATNKIPDYIIEHLEEEEDEFELV